MQTDETMKDKDCATRLAFDELAGLINVAKFSQSYFNHTPAWFNQKLRHHALNNKPARFNAAEYDKVTASLRDLANRLTRYADAIDSAPLGDD